MHHTRPSCTCLHAGCTVRTAVQQSQAGVTRCKPPRHLHQGGTQPPGIWLKAAGPPSKKQAKHRTTPPATPGPVRQDTQSPETTPQQHPCIEQAHAGRPTRLDQHSTTCTDHPPTHPSCQHHSHRRSRARWGCPCSRIQRGMQTPQRHTACSAVPVPQLLAGRLTACAWTVPGSCLTCRWGSAGHTSGSPLALRCCRGSP